MKLKFIALDRLAVSKANMRHGRKAPDVSDILPTVRTRGVLQPILVRASSEPGMFEIVAGRRRYHAAMIVAAERATLAPPVDQERDDVPVTAQGVATQVPRPESGPESNPASIPASRTEPDPASDLGSDPDGCAVLPGSGEPSSFEIACAVLDDADDAAAIEASLIENIARLDPDEVSRWECFTRLVREGRSPEQIGQTFGLPDLAVRRVLALGNLLPRIRDLYRREEIDALTVRHLTMASKSQQKAWLALLDDADAWVPRGHQLRNWVLGGQSIPVSHALFDVADSGLAIVADLFGDAPFFAEPEAFWTRQNAAIEARREDYPAAGWPDAVVIGIGEHFHGWEYEKTPRRKGGRVYIEVRASGEVVFHEGYLTRKEAARLAKQAEAKAAGGTGGEPGTGATSSLRPELTAVTRNYVDLHRHAAVRAALLDSPGVTLRLMVAHVVCGSSLWRVSVDPQATRNEGVHESVIESRGEAVFDARRRSVLSLLECDPQDATVTGGTGWTSPDRDLPAVFARLLALPDPEVLEVVAVAMGETLAVGGSAVEIAGAEIGLSMAEWWQADDAFFEGLRDREVLLAMLAEVAGSDIAKANEREKGRALKTIIRDHLAGNNGRVRRGNWVPRWMAFPPADYTARGIYAAALASEAEQAPAPSPAPSPAHAMPEAPGLSGDGEGMVPAPDSVEGDESARHRTAGDAGAGNDGECDRDCRSQDGGQAEPGETGIKEAREPHLSSDSRDPADSARDESAGVDAAGPLGPDDSGPRLAA